MQAPGLGTCAVVGTPTVHLAYSSAKKSRHILETHWLGFSISIVILARGHGSGNVDRQCNSSDVSSGAITGSSPSFGRYCMAVVALPLLWVLAASCADWMRGPCWLTMALKYSHARMATLRVLGPSSVWFLAAVARFYACSADIQCKRPWTHKEKKICVNIHVQVAGSQILLAKHLRAATKFSDG